MTTLSVHEACRLLVYCSQELNYTFRMSPRQIKLRFKFLHIALWQMQPHRQPIPQFHLSVTKRSCHVPYSLAITDDSEVTHNFQLSAMDHGEFCPTRAGEDQLQGWCSSTHWNVMTVGNIEMDRRKPRNVDFPSVHGRISRSQQRVHS